METTFSVILEMKLRLETGLYFFRLFTGRFDFYSRGVTRASLNDSGNVPDSRDKLIIVVMGLIKIFNKALKMFVGIGSRSHDFDADFIMI